MQRKSIKEICAMLEGPVNSIPTTFNRDGTPDWEGVRNIIEKGIDGGSSVSLLTYGDSHLEVLSDDELKELTRILVDRSAGRTLTVAANRPWGTDKSIEYAEFCRDLGVDMLMLTTGMHIRTLDAVSLSSYYKDVAGIIPIMIVGAPEHSLLDELVDEPAICSFKEDGSVEYACDTIRRYGSRWKFMTGGGLWRNYTHWAFGCSAFMSPWCNIAPKVNLKYYKAMMDNDMKAANEVIIKFDWPLFDMSSGYSGGWQSFWRGILELTGLAGRYRRLPFPSLTDAEMERLKDDIKQTFLIYDEFTMSGRQI